ncbi:MAG TPA: hypothetical protein PLX97_09270 [Gemmatales bacterium]|nr:hypothetical protein [Gemmatales bacterium]
MGAGCTSIVSHHVTKDTAGCLNDTKQLRGIPVTIKVPYQLQVTITESNYLKVDGDKTELIRSNNEKKPLFTRNITMKVIDKDQVVTVDQVRPAAGKLESLVGAPSKDGGNTIHDQFFTRMGGKITDNTIQEIDAGINRIFNAATKLNVAMAASTKKLVSENKIITVDSVVAVQVFDVHSPCLEDQVRAFLEQHQCCNPPCERVHINDR